MSRLEIKDVQFEAPPRSASSSKLMPAQAQNVV
jgi:hypothetical protein